MNAFMPPVPNASVEWTMAHFFLPTVSIPYWAITLAE